MRHATEEDLVLLHYREDDWQPIQDHLEGCSTCRDAYEQLRLTLTVIDTLPVPERPADYAEQVWARLESELDREPRSDGRRLRTWRSTLSAPRVALVGALAASLVLAFWLGRSTGPGPVPQPVRERVLFVAVSDHLDRSQRLLIELSHAEPGEGHPGAEVDITSQQRAARRLAADNKVYRRTAEIIGDETVAELLDELDRLLLQIAHGPDRLNGIELAGLQRRMARRGLLLKVRVIGEDVRRRADEAKPKSHLL